MSFSLRLFAPLLVVLAVFVPAGLSPASEGQCLAKREIQAKVSAGEVMQLADAVASAGIDGKIISSGAELCEQGGIWQWVVTVMDDQGQARMVSVPAE